MNNPDFISFITQLARASANYILPYFQSCTLAVEQKEDQTPVTLADRGAEQLMRSMISEKYPHHGIIGEEFGSERPDAEFVWIMDPIDGTKSFVKGVPLFGSLIALLHNGKPLIGVINFPALGIFCIGDGNSTCINNAQVRVNKNSDISRATILCTDIKSHSQFQSHENLDLLIKKCDLFRTWGDCYGYYLVAAGWSEIMLDPIMNPWDLLPLIPIIEGAGGVITSWAGDSAVNANSCIATNGLLHSEVLEILNRKI